MGVLTTNMDNDLCLISDVEYDETSTRPVIVNFENGKLQPGQENNLSSQIYRNKQDKLLIAVTTDKMLYSGTVNRDELYNTFIGIRNKRTNKVRLVATDYASLSPMLPKKMKLLDTSLSTTQSTAAELNKQFGSKRIKRQTEQRERMQLDIENVREQLEQTVAETHVNVQDMVAPAIDENDSYKPPINRSASKVENVYALEDIISSAVFDSLAAEAQRVLETEDEIDTTTFITQQINALSQSPADNTTKCQLLLYIDCLIKFMLVNAKAVGNRKYNACSYSEAVHKDILQKFTVVSAHGRLRPNVMKDKCLCYILVLSMIACGYKLNLETLSKKLKMGLKKLQDVSRVLAFTVSKEIVTLQLPLPAPVLSLSKRDRKRR